MTAALKTNGARGNGRRHCGACGLHNQSSEYVPLRQAARRLGVPWPRVVEMIRAGTLKARLVGGAHWFVDRQSLSQFARQRRGHQPFRGRAA